jgi:hypothetical protein
MRLWVLLLGVFLFSGGACLVSANSRRLTLPFLGWKDDHGTSVELGLAAAEMNCRAFVATR